MVGWAWDRVVAPDALMTWVVKPGFGSITFCVGPRTSVPSAVLTATM